MRLCTIASCLAAALLAGCDDATTAPEPNPGHYVLVSVNDQAVPATFPSYTYDIGDLLLRSDGTYVLGAGALVSGTYSVEGTRLNFAGIARSDRLDAIMAGDSVVISLAYSGQTESGGLPSILHLPGTTRLLFRRATFADASAASGTYTLSTVNGQGDPLIIFDSTTSQGRVTHRVRYGSLTLIGGIFFRGRLQVDFYLDGTLNGGLGAAPIGSVRPKGNALVLTSYYPPPAFTKLPFPDLLDIDAPALVRRTVFTNRTLEERYTRP